VQVRSALFRNVAARKLVVQEEFFLDYLRQIRSSETSVKYQTTTSNMSEEQRLLTRCLATGYSLNLRDLKFLQRY